MAKLYAFPVGSLSRRDMISLYEALEWVIFQEDLGAIKLKKRQHKVFQVLADAVERVALQLQADGEYAASVGYDDEPTRGRCWDNED